MAAAELRRSFGSEQYVSDIQRGRLLSATFALVGEGGFEGVNARRVSERAGVSNRTFYECFSDREDCFLAAFNYAVEGLEREARAGWESEPGWVAGVRAALASLLRALDREPAVSRLVFVEALGAGPRVLASRARVLESLAGVVDQGRSNAKAPRGLPPLVAEGVVGGAFGVIHARLLELRPEPLIGLLGSLMAMIVLPYRGGEAAARELTRPIPRSPIRRRDGDGFSRRPLGAASPIDYRLTARTQMALAAVAGRPGLNNREVSEVIGLADQGQVSRMMRRLSEQGLVVNAQGHVNRQVKAWRLTRDGEAVIDTRRSLKQAGKAGKGGKRRGTQIVRPAGQEIKSLGREGGRDRSAGRISGPAFRMTVLTHAVLTTVATLSKGENNPSNREVAQTAGVKDQGQISKLLARLEAHGMLENSGGHPGAVNAWRLTSRGEQLLSASSPAIAGAGR